MHTIIVGLNQVLISYVLNLYPLKTYIKFMNRSVNSYITYILNQDVILNSQKIP